jgi:chromate reductase
MHLLAICGSLRAASANKALIAAAMSVAPDDVTIELYDELGALPHFNPDLDDAGAPDVVVRFRERLMQADGVLISSPEYAHGVPGVMKNALDWVVGTGELVGKRVALLNASPRSTIAQAQLRETLKTMNWAVVDQACVAIQMRGRDIDDHDRDALRASLNAMRAQ